jgi:hypothetical protein
MSLQSNRSFNLGTRHAAHDSSFRRQVGQVLSGRRRPRGTAFINPRSIVRARVYHSLQSVDYPAGLLCLEADDI